MKKNVIFAIDYGTSNSLLCATDGETVTPPVILDEKAPDPTVLRSILYFPHMNECHYGQSAIEMYSENQAAGRLIRSIKKYLPSESFLGSWIDDRLVRLEDLIGFFLLEMKKRASRQLGVESDSVLLGRPAKFSDDPIKDKLAEYRMKKAAELAGFKNVAFLPEPLAAAFELRKRLTESKTVLVVDLGGGTSDFTVIRIGPHAYREEDLLAMGGISVAGDAVDGALMKEEISPWFGSKVRYRVPLGRNIMQMPKSLLDHICSPADIAQLRRSDYMSFFRDVHNWAVSEEEKKKLERLFVLVEDQLGFELFERIDRVKRELSENEKARFELDYPGIDLKGTISRASFETHVAPPADKILATMDETMRSAQLSYDQIDLVYCTGGTSKLSLIQKGLAERVSPEKIVRNNFFHSVIEGLAAYAKESLK